MGTVESWVYRVGHPLSRQEIAKLYNTISRQDVLTVVPEEGIYLVMNTVLEQGDQIIVTFPGYQSLYAIAQARGCEVSHWIPQWKEGWQFEIKDLLAQVKKNTRMIVINFPHNPTGHIINTETLYEIIRLAEKNGIILFSDEMYHFLEYDPKIRLPTVRDLYEKGIPLFGMSKSFALPGLRAGWLVTKDREIYTGLTTYKDYTTLCSSAPSEILTLTGPRAKDQILERSLSIIKQNLELMNKFFQRKADLFAWETPKAGTLAFPKWKGRGTAAELCADLIEKKGVLLVPAQQFDFKGEYLRFGFGRTDMPEALYMLDEYLGENSI